MMTTELGALVNIQTGKLDANASSNDGQYPFFTCAREPLRIDNWKYDLDAVLIAGNGDLNVKHYKGKFDAYQRTYILSVSDNQKVDTRYLYYFMDTYLEHLREQSIGGIIKYIKLGMLKEAPIPLPPLDEQKRIAAILDQADELRRLRQRAIDRLNQLGQAIFYEMFGDPATNPKGWSTKELDTLIVDGPQNGLYKPSTAYGEGTPILRIDSFYDGQITKLLQLQRLSVSQNEIQTYGLRKNDLVINRVNNIEYLGKSAIVPTLSEPTVFESNMMRFRVDEKVVLPVFLINYLQTFFIKSQIRTRTKDAVNQSSINQQDIKSFTVRVPPLKLQEHFEKLIVMIEGLAPALREGVVSATALFVSLQHSAFRGEL